MLAALVILSAALADPKQLADQLMASAPPETRQQLSQIDLPRFVRAFVAVIGGMALFIGVSMIGCAFSVRKGNRAGTIYAMVIVSLCCLWWMFNVLTGVIHLASGALIGAAEILFAGCLSFVFGLCLFWLIGSVRAISSGFVGRTMLPEQIQNPPGYAGGYGAQTSIPLPPPPTNPAQ